MKVGERKGVGLMRKNVTGTAKRGEERRKTEEEAERKKIVKVEERT